jgi:hypothetical protein
MKTHDRSVVFIEKSLVRQVFLLLKIVHIISYITSVSLLRKLDEGKDEKFGHKINSFQNKNVIFFAAGAM